MIKVYPFSIYCVKSVMFWNGLIKQPFSKLMLCAINLGSLNDLPPRKFSLKPFGVYFDQYLECALCSTQMLVKKYNNPFNQYENCVELKR